MNIQGQAALVTGGGSGLGEATARELARLGAKVAVLDVNLANAQKVAAEIGGVACQCDITNTDSVQAAHRWRRRRPRPGAHPDEHRRHRRGQAHRRQGRQRRPAGRLCPVVNVNLIGTYNISRLFAAACAKLAPLEDGERGVMVFTAVGRRLRRPGGPAGLQRLQGRRGRHDAAHGARPGAARHPRVHHRPGPVRHAAAAHAARAGPGFAGGQHPVPASAWASPKSSPQLAAHIVTNGHLNGEVIRLDGALRMAPR
jgi:NAD(P)-dependent dehydrogenase (short-subunit alcohol dehydrogenase family)